MKKEEAIKILKAIRVYECYPKSASEETKEAIDIAIEALSVNNKAVYCWECKYKYDCVQYMLVEGKYEIIHSCSYGKRR